jgi:hypothetical protein
VFSFEPEFNIVADLQIYSVGRVGHITMKSTSLQVRKLFIVAPQRKRRSSKAQLRSLRFKILRATFVTSFGIVKHI